MLTVVREDTAELLRFATAGSVDDGKSTLIGRLLYDSKQVLADQLEHVEQASVRRHGEGTLDLSLLVDGLRAEREQGITIDVAYRYFATARRRFIIADTPGHEQYTRNMVTGASTADLAVILVDARNGVVEQSRRHAVIATLLGIPHLVVAVNKMDLVGWSEDVFDAVVVDFCDWSRRLGTPEITFIPISALHGDNVVGQSDAAPWYEGPALLDHLESVPVAPREGGAAARFPVQWVIRPPDGDYRGYAGQVAGGELRPGDDVLLLPSGRTTRLAAVETESGPLAVARPPMSVTLRFEDDLDVARGELVTHPADPPAVTRELEATVCWMAEAPLRERGRYLLKHTTRTVKAVVDRIEDRLDVVTLEREPLPGELAMNELGRVHLRVSTPLAVDPYAENRTTGSFILIDETTNDTVGAGLIGA
ncbi:MAG: putative sulfate adenylyltransferase subunit 1 [Solirubrobacterales bacterium]|nr:putative sulfate adenylyltransferase subunit 1 [Solirubrobacterales bacterium]